MNIFILSLNVLKCALYHCDKHICKMILEAAELLCNAVILTGGKAGYDLVLPNHKCTLWVMRSLANWTWLKSLLYALNDEYKFRFSKTQDHSSIGIVNSLEQPNLPDIGMTSFHQAMPAEFKDPDVVTAYRKYYAGTKFNFATWKKREIPKWYVKLRMESGGDALKEVSLLLNPSYMKEKRKKLKEEKIKKQENKALIKLGKRAKSTNSVSLKRSKNEGLV